MIGSQCKDLTKIMMPVCVCCVWWETSTDYTTHHNHNQGVGGGYLLAYPKMKMCVCFYAHAPVPACMACFGQSNKKKITWAKHNKGVHEGRQSRGGSNQKPGRSAESTVCLLFCFVFLTFGCAILIYVL